MHLKKENTYVLIHCCLLKSIKNKYALFIPVLCYNSLSVYFIISFVCPYAVMALWRLTIFQLTAIIIPILMLKLGSGMW